MITKKQFDKLYEFLLDENNPEYLLDVMVDGKEKASVFFEGEWYLIPVNFKFGNEIHRGQPYLELNPDLIEMVHEDYLKTLPTWSYDHKTGTLATWSPIK